MSGLVEHFGGEPSVHDSGSYLEWLDDFAASHWDYRAGAERNLVPDRRASPETEDLVLNASRALGLDATYQPEHHDYDAILVLGGLLRACLARPTYARQVLDQGVRARSVVALGGFRPLAGDELELASPLELPGEQLDEFHAMVEGVTRAFGPLGDPAVSEERADSLESSSLVYRYAGPPEVTVVAAPSSAPEQRRANTRDTYKYWIEQIAPLPCGSKVLVITTAIYVPYQGCVAIESLGVSHGLTVETIGVANDSPLFGLSPQRLKWSNYLQEIRSAIGGMLALYRSLSP